MRIGILTFFESNNYGTVLQAYALQKYLTDLGHNAELVHIKRNVNAVSKHFKAQGTEYSLLDRIGIKLRTLHSAKSDDTKKRRFGEFRDKYLNVSSVFYESDEQLKEDPPEYDLYLAGGDQIWNPYHKIFSTHYMWDFLPDGKRIASFSSSFGVNHIEDEQWLQTMSNQLKRFEKICVREQSGVDIIHAMGLEASAVLDPVFLLKDQWKQFVHPRKSKKYCLVYALIDYPKEDDERIKAIAKQHDLKIKIMPNNRRNCLNNYSTDFDAGPLEFLNIVANAEVVFTNSFHGLAFALLFGKQVRLLSAVTDEGNSKRDRLNDLIRQFGINTLEETVDYGVVNEQMTKLLALSRDRLETILEI